MRAKLLNITVEWTASYIFTEVVQVGTLQELMIPKMWRGADAACGEKRKCQHVLFKQFFLHDRHDLFLAVLQTVEIGFPIVCRPFQTSQAPGLCPRHSTREDHPGLCLSPNCLVATLVWLETGGFHKLSFFKALALAMMMFRKEEEAEPLIQSRTQGLYKIWSKSGKTRKRQQKMRSKGDASGQGCYSSLWRLLCNCPRICSAHSIATVLSSGCFLVRGAFLSGFHIDGGRHFPKCGHPEVVAHLCRQLKALQSSAHQFSLRP